MKTFYEGKNVLVTGGCGFIGSHLAEKLVEFGAHVTILDDLSGGFEKNIKNIKDDVTFLNETITNSSACLQATKNKDIIFHLAALVSVPESVENPDLCHAINVDGTVNLLEAARLNGVERFVFSSSAAVYGATEKVCLETMPCQPLSPYGFSKYIGEQYCKQYAINYGLNTVTMRYFNVYGPRQNPNGAYAAVCAIFDKQMSENIPITIYGDGKQTRDFVHVCNVVEANLLLGMQNKEVMNGQVFNVATGKTVSLLELVDQLKESHPDYSQEIRFEPARVGDIKHSSADCSKYMKIRREYTV